VKVDVGVDPDQIKVPSEVDGTGLRYNLRPSVPNIDEKAPQLIIMDVLDSGAAVIFHPAPNGCHGLTGELPGIGQPVR
jgi:hypothetical protein